MAPIEMLLYSFFLYVKWKPKSSRSSDDLMHYLETPFLLVKCSNQRYLLTKKRKGSLQQVYCSQSLSRVVLISLSLTHSLSHTQLLNCYLLSHPISFSLSLSLSISPSCCLSPNYFVLFFSLWYFLVSCDVIIPTIITISCSDISSCCYCCSCSCTQVYFHTRKQHMLTDDTRDTYGLKRVHRPTRND